MFKKEFLKAMMAVLAVLLALQFYFVRQLLAAELFFAFGFAILLLLGGLSYFVGLVAERGLESAGAGARMIGCWVSRVWNLEKTGRSHSAFDGRIVELVSNGAISRTHGVSSTSL